MEDTSTNSIDPRILDLHRYPLHRTSDSPLPLGDLRLEATVAVDAFHMTESIPPTLADRPQPLGNAETSWAILHMYF